MGSFGENGENREGGRDSLNDGRPGVIGRMVLGGRIAVV